MKRFVLVVLFFLLVTQALSDEKRFSVPLNDSPAYGPASARVTIIEFLDFQ